MGDNRLVNGSNAHRGDEAAEMSDSILWSRDRECPPLASKASRFRPSKIQVANVQRCSLLCESALAMLEAIPDRCH